MGYLSQKKHQIRENLFLNVTSVVLTFFTLFSLINANFDINFPNLFHLYIFSFVMIVYSLIVKKHKLTLIFVMLFIINYTALSSSSNIFLSDSYEGTKKIKLSFDNTADVDGYFNKEKTSSGSLILADIVIAPYTKIKGNKPMTIIKINLGKYSSKVRKKVLKQLKNFVIKQDNPVILYGDFGVPAWNRYLRRFMVQTRLSIKNRLLFTKGASYNIFTTPSFYILGFNAMGIENLKIKNNDKTVTFDVLF